MAVKTGLRRIAKALRWLSLGWLALGAALGMTGALGDFGDTIIVVMLVVIPSVIGVLLGWIVDVMASPTGRGKRWRY
jgi:hypothetical protein